jgi:glycosyl transferase family 2
VTGARTRATGTLPATSASAPTVSVIIPCYNYGHFLDGCLASVLGQQGVNVEVLVIDDLSPDGSAEVAADLCAADPRVEFRAHRVNRGLIPTANEGLEWARGDYVLLLSADDLLVPGALWRATSVMEAHPNVGLVYGRPVLAGSDAAVPRNLGRWRSTHIWRGEDWIRLRCASAYNAMSSPEVIVRTSIQRSVGLYDPACHHCSDLNMWLRVASIADVAHVRGVPQAVYRIHGESMQRGGDGPQDAPLIDLSERRIAFDRFFDAETSRLLARPADLALTVRRRLARQALWEASRIVDRATTPHQPVVDELTTFARDVYPAAPGLREWWGLSVRRRLGLARSRWFVPFTVTAVGHRLSYRARRARWRLTGV